MNGILKHTYCEVVLFLRVGTGLGIRKGGTLRGLCGGVAAGLELEVEPEGDLEAGFSSCAALRSDSITAKKKNGLSLRHFTSAALGFCIFSLSLTK